MEAGCAHLQAVALQNLPLDQRVCACTGGLEKNLGALLSRELLAELCESKK